MTAHCPSCASAALGTDAASICTQCMSVSAAGASVSIPTVLATATLALLCAIAIKSGVQTLARRTQAAPA